MCLFVIVFPLFIMPRLTLRTKLELIEYHENKRATLTQIAKKFDVSTGTVGRILKEKGQWVKFYNSTKNKRNKTFTCSEQAVVEEELHKWLENKSVTKFDLRKQVKSIIKDHKLDFKITSKWVKDFIKRHQVVLKKNVIKKQVQRHNEHMNGLKSDKCNNITFEGNSELLTYLALKESKRKSESPKLKETYSSGKRISAKKNIIATRKNMCKVNGPRKSSKKSNSNEEKNGQYGNEEVIQVKEEENDGIQSDLPKNENWTKSCSKSGHIVKIIKEDTAIFIHNYKRRKRKRSSSQNENENNVLEKSENIGHTSIILHKNQKKKSKQLLLGDLVGESVGAAKKSEGCTKNYLMSKVHLQRRKHKVRSTKEYINERVTNGRKHNVQTVNERVTIVEKLGTCNEIPSLIKPNDVLEEKITTHESSAVAVANPQNSKKHTKISQNKGSSVHVNNITNGRKTRSYIKKLESKLPLEDETRIDSGKHNYAHYLIVKKQIKSTRLDGKISEDQTSNTPTIRKFSDESVVDPSMGLSHNQRIQQTKKNSDACSKRYSCSQNVENSTPTGGIQGENNSSNAKKARNANYFLKIEESDGIMSANESTLTIETEHEIYPILKEGIKRTELTHITSEENENRIWICENSKSENFEDTQNPDRYRRVTRNWIQNSAIDETNEKELTSVKSSFRQNEENCVVVEDKLKKSDGRKKDNGRQRKNISKNEERDCIIEHKKKRTRSIIQNKETSSKATPKSNRRRTRNNSQLNEKNNSMGTTLNVKQNSVEPNRPVNNSDETPFLYKDNSNFRQKSENYREINRLIKNAAKSVGVKSDDFKKYEAKMPHAGSKSRNRRRTDSQSKETKKHVQIDDKRIRRQITTKRKESNDVILNSNKNTSKTDNFVKKVDNVGAAHKSKNKRHTRKSPRTGKNNETINERGAIQTYPSSKLKHTRNPSPEEASERSCLENQQNRNNTPKKTLAAQNKEFNSKTLTKDIFKLDTENDGMLVLNPVPLGLVKRSKKLVDLDAKTTRCNRHKTTDDSLSNIQTPLEICNTKKRPSPIKYNLYSSTDGDEPEDTLRRKRRKLRKRPTTNITMDEKQLNVVLNSIEVEEEHEDNESISLNFLEPNVRPNKIEILSNIQITSPSNASNSQEEQNSTVPIAESRNITEPSSPTFEHLNMSWSNLFPELNQGISEEELVNQINEIEFQYDPDVFKDLKIEVLSSGYTDEDDENEVESDEYDYTGIEGDDEFEDDDIDVPSTQGQQMPPPNQMPQPPNSMQCNYRPPMSPNGRAPAPRGPQPSGARMPGGPRPPMNRAPGMRPRAPLVRPRGAGNMPVRGQMRPRMGAPQNGIRPGGQTSPIKRGPEQNQAGIKRKKVDVLTPSDKDDDDCQVICMQPKNTGLPQIESVQGAESVENSIMKLSDSITLSVTKTAPKPTSSPQKSDAKAVANVLASRGITVTASGKAKESPTKQGSAVPTALSLNGSVSIVAASKNATSKSATSENLPTVDLTDDTPSPGSPGKNRQGLPYRCDLCPAQYPNAIGLNKHRQTYHKTNSGMCELGVPLINLKQPGMMQKLSQLGIHNYIPLPGAGPEGTYALPIISTKSPGNVAQIGATQMLSLGPVRAIPRLGVNNNNIKK